MERIINKIWLLIFIAALIVSAWVSIQEGFVRGKVYMLLILALFAAWRYGFEKFMFWKK